MSLFSFFRRIYDVDTLDTRFTTPSTVPYKAVSSASDRTQNSSAGPTDGRRDATADIIKRAERSKWRTPEFFFYYLVFMVAIPYMFWVPYDVSRRTELPVRA